MLQVGEFSDEHLFSVLRKLVTDLCDKQSPFNKDEDYMRNLAGWVACAATRIETLSMMKKAPH